MCNNMLTRSHSFPARVPPPRKVVFEEEPSYTIIVDDVYDDHDEPLSHVPVTKRVNKKLCFLVDTGTSQEWWSIDEFLDEGFITDETVCHWINHKNEVAKTFPNVKRRCLMCNRFALKGKTICFDYHKIDGVKARDYIY